MDKIVGSIGSAKIQYALAFISCCMSWHACADITLSTTDLRGARLEKVGVGQPFMLNVAIADVSTSSPKLFIAGIEKFDLEQNDTFITNINGKSTAQYTFKIRINSPGAHTIGPAVIQDSGFKFVSNKLKIIVDEHAPVPEARAENKKENTVFLRLLCDKKKAVVGEKIPCTLRFYYTDDELSVKRIIEQPLPDFVLKNAQKARKGAEKIDGADYQYIELRWDMYPRAAGRKVIPAYGVDFEQYEERDDLWGGLGKFFGPRAERKRVYSNALSIDVESLPSTDKTICAIGSQLNARAFVKPATAKKGEGMVLSIELEGDGDIENIKTPKLQGIPDELRYYDSRQEFIEAKNPGQLPKKRFEYILQGLACGSWEIPKQSFVYFDVEKRKYKTIETTPLLITVVPGAAAQQVILVDDDRSAHYEQPDGDASATISPLHVNGWYPVPERAALPWWLFIMLSILPIVFHAYATIIGRWRRYRTHHLPYHKRKNAFAIARAQLKQAQKEDDVSVLHHIFISLMANRYARGEAEISGESMKQILHNAGMVQKVLDEWDAFFGLLSAYVFGQKKEKKNHTQLFAQAAYWIEQLEKAL